MEGKNATSIYLSCCRDCSLPLKMFGGRAVSAQEHVSKQPLGSGFQRQNPMGLLDQENFFLDSSLDQLCMEKIIICWVCLGLAASKAGCSLDTVWRRFPTAPLQGGPGWRAGSPHPTESCWAARSCEKGKLKSQSLFHPCCYYTNQSIGNRAFQLQNQVKMTDQKPLLTWVLSDKRKGLNSTSSRSCTSPSQGSLLVTGKEWLAIVFYRSFMHFTYPWLLQSDCENSTFGQSLQPSLITSVENKREEKVLDGLFPGIVKWLQALHRRLMDYQNLLNNAFHSSLAWLQ